MSDLISRSALMEEIKSLSVHITGLRAGKGILANFMDEYRKSVLKIIDEQPTAYDVEKVAEELSSNSRFVEDINEHNIKCISCVIGQKTAIDIVKKAVRYDISNRRTGSSYA